MAKQHQQLQAMGEVALSFSADVYKKLFPGEYVKKCIEHNVRPDSRTLDAARAVHLQTNVIQTAASSALVKMGNTSVITAIKLAVGTPAVATPDQGDIAIQVHLTPLCSTRFNIGRPSEEAQAISSQLSRIIIGSRVVEMSDLSIEKGKSAWRLMVDVYCIDHDGNVLDASLTSIMAALQTLRLPATSINENDHVVSLVPDAESTPLRMQHSAYSTTFAILNGKLLLDPTAQEEELASTVFSIAYTTNGQLCAVHKPGGSALSAAKLQQCKAVAKARAELLTNQLGSNHVITP